MLGRASSRLRGPPDPRPMDACDCGCDPPRRYQPLRLVGFSGWGFGSFCGRWRRGCLGPARRGATGVLLLETLDPTSRVDQLLLTRVERVALVTELDVKLGFHR